jgi:pimeloyl-ACP methyl ester carboxylesterase
MFLKKILSPALFLAISFFSHASLLFGMDANEQPAEACYIFAHGLGPSQAGVQFHLEGYRNTGVIGGNSRDGSIVISTQSPCFNDTEDWAHSSLGQEADIAVLRKTIEQTIARNPDVRIIGLGVSRGAAAWINTIGVLAQRNARDTLSHIAALVLESPFCDTTVLANGFINKYGLHHIGMDSDNFFVKWIAKNGLSFVFKQHKPSDIQPITSIVNMQGKVPSDLPIFFLHSQQDQLIPINHSRKLVKQFIKSGFTHVYLAEVPKGCHANVFWGGSSLQACTYLQVFYRSNHLSNSYDLLQHEENVTEDALLGEMRPDSDELNRRIFEDEPCCFLRQIWNTIFSQKQDV